MQDDPLSVQGEVLIKNVYAREEISGVINKTAKSNCETSSLVLLWLSKMKIIDMNLSFEVTLKTL